MEAKIICCCDEGSFAFKEEILDYLQKKGYNIQDSSVREDGSKRPYYEAGALVGEAISKKEYKFGLVFCGSGMGVCMSANRYEGVYCAVCESLYTVELAREINNANVLALGGNIIAPKLGCLMAETFLNTAFLDKMDNKEFLISALKQLDDIDQRAHHMQ